MSDNANPKKNTPNNTILEYSKTGKSTRLQPIQIRMNSRMYTTNQDQTNAKSRNPYENDTQKENIPWS